VADGDTGYVNQYFQGFNEVGVACMASSSSYPTGVAVFIIKNSGAL
jgi:hypothetical protein